MAACILIRFPAPVVVVFDLLFRETSEATAIAMTRKVAIPSFRDEASSKLDLRAAVTDTWMVRLHQRMQAGWVPTL